MKLITPSLLFLFAVVSCSVLEPDDRYSSPAGIDSISITKSDARSVNFLAYIYCGSMCWNDYYFTSSIKGNEIELKLHVSFSGNPCPAVCVEQEYPYLYQTYIPGTYKFRFWQNDSTSIDITITFN